MAEYRVLFRESVWKDLRPIPKKELEKILDRIAALGGAPRPSEVEKLSGRDCYRVRQGRYRIVYSVQNKEQTVWLVKVEHRKDVYR